MAVNKCYYNASENIYLYPMVNVIQAYEDNELLLMSYVSSSIKETPKINAQSWVREDTSWHYASYYTYDFGENEYYNVKIRLRRCLVQGIRLLCD